MSGLAGDMDSTSEITHARILNRLFDESTKKFHTEIRAPLAMSTLDSAQSYVDEEFGAEVGDFWRDIRDWLRTNWVAKDRQRAKEIIEGVKAELAREEREMRDRMMGTISR